MDTRSLRQSAAETEHAEAFRVDQLTQAVIVRVGRRRCHFQQVVGAVFLAEIDAAPGAGEVSVAFPGQECVLAQTGVLAFIDQRLMMDANRQAVIQRGFAGEVDFGFPQDVEMADLIGGGAGRKRIVHPSDVAQRCGRRGPS